MPQSPAPGMQRGATSGPPGCRPPTMQAISQGSTTLVVWPAHNQNCEGLMSGLESVRCAKYAASVLPTPSTGQCTQEVGIHFCCKNGNGLFKAILIVPFIILCLKVSKFVNTQSENFT